jgi:hypothetical protein
MEGGKVHLTLPQKTKIFSYLLLYHMLHKKGQPGAHSSHLCRVRERVRPQLGLMYAAFITYSLNKKKEQAKGKERKQQII